MHKLFSLIVSLSFFTSLHAADSASSAQVCQVYSQERIEIFLAIHNIFIFIDCFYKAINKDDVMDFIRYRRGYIDQAVIESIADKALRSIVVNVTPNPNPFWFQLKQGLYLSCGIVPYSLYSEFGEIVAYNEIESRDIEACEKSGIPEKIFYDLKQYVTLKFIKNFGEQEADGKITFYKDSFMNPISKSQLNTYRGKDARIFASDGRRSLYAVVAIKGSKELPQPIDNLVRNQYRSHDAINKDWQALSELVKRQK